jgi:hypothetical protein
MINRIGTEGSMFVLVRIHGKILVKRAMIETYGKNNLDIFIQLRHNMMCWMIERDKKEHSTKK